MVIGTSITMKAATIIVVGIKDDFYAAAAWAGTPHDCLITAVSRTRSVGSTLGVPTF